MFLWIEQLLFGIEQKNHSSLKEKYSKIIEIVEMHYLIKYSFNSVIE